MYIRPESISTLYAPVAPGVTRFAWHAHHNNGDGLLVDMDTAHQWCDLADVLFWPTPVDPAAAVARAARSQAVLAVVATRRAHWLLFTFSHNVNPAFAVRTVAHRAALRAADRSAVFEVVVERYRTVVTRHGPCC
jgi:hypothetical protein